MPNRNGQGPMGTGSGTGRGRGLCHKSNQPGLTHQEPVQSQAATELQPSAANCRGLRNCGAGTERRKKSCGNRRGQC